MFVLIACRCVLFLCFKIFNLIKEPLGEIDILNRFFSPHGGDLYFSCLTYTTLASGSEVEPHV